MSEALQVGDRPKYGQRFVEVIEVSACGRFVRIKHPRGGKREWVDPSLLHVTSRTMACRELRAKGIDGASKKAQ